jgi:hypothetical protein
MTLPAELDRMRHVIQDLHGAGSRHVGSIQVRESYRGEIVWDGVFEVFAVIGHPNGTQACAWSHRTDHGGRRYVALLHVPPVNSAADAVRAAIVAEHRAR